MEANVTNEVVRGQFFYQSTHAPPFLWGWLANVTNNTGGDVRVGSDVACAERTI